MKVRVLLAACSLMLWQRAAAQAPLLVYAEDLANNFENWSSASNNLGATYGGSNCLSVSAASGQALSFGHADFSTTPYQNAGFWINGGAGGQLIRFCGMLDGAWQSFITIGPLVSNRWVNFNIPLSDLGLADQPNCSGFCLQMTEAGTTNTFYVAEFQLGAVPAPALTQVGVDASHAIRVADTRWFGINTATWDNYLDTPETLAELQELGFGFLRFPGGSMSDDYHWATDTTDANTWQWAMSFTNFEHVATNLGAQALLTANYGTGTPAEAAAWVQAANVLRHDGFQYWEIGNEEYGTWETDSNVYPHDPYTYATRAQAYMEQMKAVDPTIKVGVVVATGEDSYVNYTNHPATNAATGQVHYGWTPVLLSTLKTLGARPDFLIDHWYPEWTDSESDPFLLQGATNWIGDAANLREMITDYYGAGGTNIELLVTENNSNAGAQGKQSLSLVNALYYVQSSCQLMQTEFNSHVWWDLRNGLDLTGSMNPTLYGWRLYGDLGMINGSGTTLSNRYPQFFTAKLMQHFLGGGDTVLEAGSDYRLLGAYAARRTNGSLTLLVINMDAISSFTANIGLTNFSPAPEASLWSYGMPQDNAARTGVGSCDVAQSTFTGAATNFDYTFAPYSVTVFGFAPAAPLLAATPLAGAGNQFTFQLKGQAGAPYVIQISTDLSRWTSVSTNLAMSGTLNITNPIVAGGLPRYWRAVWVP